MAWTCLSRPTSKRVCTMKNEAQPGENRRASSRRRHAEGYRRPSHTPEHRRAARQRQKSKLTVRAVALVGQARYRAVKYDRPITITPEWVLERLIAGHCEATGFPFTFDVGKGHQPYTPSIDRVDSALGYTPENCRVVITAFNHGRNQWSDDILAGWARAFLKQYDSAH